MKHAVAAQEERAKELSILQEQTRTIQELEENLARCQDEQT